MRKVSFTAFVALCTFLALPMAGAGFDWKTDYAKRWATSKDFTLSVANAMPADGYSYIPPSTVEPQERTFGELLVHIGQANVNYFSRVSGTKGPARPTGAEKAAVIQYLTDVYDYCSKSLDGMTDEQLDKTVGEGARAMLGRDALWSAFTHAAHTRGQAEVYLRLKNVKPPAYQF
ncbi:MAG: DinB family protein [Bryobacterales bacterium]|nr:DinB family protein [Bryobacterales bacterium]